MKKVFLILFTFLPYLLYSGSAGAPGEYLATYGNSAKVFGLGLAFTGCADDVSAVYFNPAGLAQVNSKQIMATFAPVFPASDINIYSIAYAHPLFSYGRIGFNWLGVFSGNYIGYDWQGLPTGITYSEKINSFLVSYSTPMIYKGVLSFGANLKFISHSISAIERSSFGFGMDLAAFHKPSQYMSAGVMIQNIIPPKLSLSSTKEYFPINFRLGAAGHLMQQKLHLYSDFMIVEPFPIEKNNSNPQFKFFTGIEYNLFKYLAFRAGFNLKEITTGFGVLYKGINLDYSYGYSFKALMLQNQYIRVSLLADLDRLKLEKIIVTPPTVGHIVLGDRDKNIIKDKELEKKITYDLINYLTPNTLKIKPGFLGIITDDYYKFLDKNSFNSIKFVIPVSEIGFTIIYDKKLVEFFKKERKVRVSFYLPGTYINLQQLETPVDAEKCSSFIKDAINHFKADLKLPVEEFEIVFPEKSFVKNNIETYIQIVKNILEFKNKNEKLWENTELIAPGYLMHLDNYSSFDKNKLIHLQNQLTNQIKKYSFVFEYETPQIRNNVVELGNLNNYISQYSSEIKDVFKTDQIFYDADLIYDLKYNPVKKQFFYALWLASGLKSLLFNGFKKVFIPLRSETMISKDVVERERLIIELDKLYPDLKIVSPLEYEKMIEKIEEGLNIKREKEEPSIRFDLLNTEEKYAGYYIYEIFNRYLFDILILDKQDYIVSKTSDENQTAIIFINSVEQPKEINLKLINLKKGIYKLQKILYTGSLFYEKVDAPKIIEEAEINVVDELKINDKILPQCITILYLKYQPQM